MQHGTWTAASIRVAMCQASRGPTRMLTAERVRHSPCKGHQGRAMAPYRIYWFGPDSHIVAGENIECASDEEAQTKAAKP